MAMRVIKIKTLREYWERQPEAEESLRAWYREANAADWDEPARIKEKYRNASILKESRVVFNIHGNNFRLIVKINYPYRVVYIRFVGTHKEYDQINAEEI